MFNEKNDPGSWRSDYAVASSGIGDTELKDRKDKKIKREGRGGAVREGSRSPAQGDKPAQDGNVPCDGAAGCSPLRSPGRAEPPGFMISRGRGGREE